MRFAASARDVQQETRRRTCSDSRPARPAPSNGPPDGRASTRERTVRPEEASASSRRRSAVVGQPPLPGSGPAVAIQPFRRGSASQDGPTPPTRSGDERPTASDHSRRRIRTLSQRTDPARDGRENELTADGHPPGLRPAEVTAHARTPSGGLRSSQAPRFFCGEMDRGRVNRRPSRNPTSPSAVRRFTPPTATPTCSPEKGPR